MENSYLLHDRNAGMERNSNDNSPEKQDRDEDRLHLNSIMNKWSRRSSFEKSLLIFAFLTVSLCLLLIIVIAAKSAPVLDGDSGSSLATGYVKTKDGKTIPICESKVCTLAAADILAAMNENFNPCEDFVSFACGGWVDLNPIPQDSSSWNQFNTLRRRLEEIISSILEKPKNESDSRPVKQMKDFYEGCLNETRIEEVGLKPLADLLDSFGGWPMTNSSWHADNFDWIRVLGETRRLLGSYYIFGVYVRTDNKNTLKNALYIDQPSLGLPRSVLVSPENYEERIRAYKTYIKKAATIISNYLGNSLNEQQLYRDVDEIYEFETTLANLSSADEDRRDMNKMYNPMTIAELQNFMKGLRVDWLSYMKEIFSHTSANITDKTRVILVEVDYIRNVSEYLNRTDTRILSNYVLWRLVMKLGDATIKALRDISMEYNKIAMGVKSVKSRNVECSGEVSTQLGLAVGMKYTDKYFSRETKAAANAMIEDIKHSFKTLLEGNKWMDDVTKPLAIEKSDTMRNVIGYPDWYDEPDGLEKYYSNLTKIHPKEFFQNILALSSYNSNEHLRKLDDPADRSEWFSSPSDVNAYYEPDFNAITFPAGILQPPFYRANAPQYLSYGGIGQVIGHEITHGFDDQGRQFNKEGNAVLWWSNETVKAFEEKIKCIRDQYEHYRVPELDENISNATVNGKTTLGENIADNGGLRAAYFAYMNYISQKGDEPRLPGLTKYTPQQVFFIANAQIWCSATTKEGLLDQILSDPHSPPEFRIIGPMSNMKEFSDVWGCPSESKMNPPKKCIVW